MYCSTHLIMRGEMAPKKKEKPGKDSSTKDANASLASDLSTGNDIFGDASMEPANYSMGPESCNASVSFDSSLHSSPYEGMLCHLQALSSHVNGLGNMNSYPMVNSNLHNAWDLNGGPAEASPQSMYYGNSSMPHATSTNAAQRTSSYRPHFDGERYLPAGYGDPHAISPSHCSMPPSSSSFCPPASASSTDTLSGPSTPGNYPVGAAPHTSKPLQIPRSHMSSVSCMNSAQPIECEFGFCDPDSKAGPFSECSRTSSATIRCDVDQSDVLEAVQAASAACRQANAANTAALQRRSGWHCEYESARSLRSPNLCLPR